MLTSYTIAIKTGANLAQMYVVVNSPRTVFRLFFVFREGRLVAWTGRNAKALCCTRGGMWRPITAQNDTAKDVLAVGVTSR